MSALEAISSSINRMVEYQLRSPEDKATAATVMGVTLSIPMDMADKRAAQATAGDGPAEYPSAARSRPSRGAGTPPPGCRERW